jgi:hypothetical protein
VLQSLECEEREHGALLGGKPRHRPQHFRSVGRRLDRARSARGRLPGWLPSCRRRALIRSATR